MDGRLTAIKKRVGSAIRARRISLKMSQEALAYEADLSATYLSQLEAGKRNPSLEALLRICFALKSDICDLFTK